MISAKKWRKTLEWQNFLFKKIRYREEMFQAKMGTIKERHGMDLTEAEYIKKRLKEYIEELRKKI